ncbi:hypothetical protein ESCO_006786 [Escovopsis weberi]|uniref:DUF8206 domain-containing protein n=1 Tax=Escovopsis weberi TaxID=150374 RepID=A0A0M9VVS6_ESCWE|nr:hypothetical protein ESCO_006786 [Escovopsis weberi]
MGETGVGKSTFINAFVNYLSFSTLDEAQEADGLTSTMDRERPDIGIQEYHVSVGARDDEEDGSKGDSATQKTAVYPVTIGSKTYRLIDTPGIGDTRGTSFDKKNMADILETISSYDELHGILILLKSNNSRLTVTFRFCVQELLTHLHRSAAEAMAFGFTNTRISNYTPGDTFKPLKTLLTAYSDVGLSLSTSTTYCFDSESFRYLAARKQGVPVDNEEDFRRSWDHSRKEALRLVDYFASTSPHPVVSTLSLNGTRKLISSLITPMAQISELVVKNLAFYEDQRNTLADTKLSADALRRRLLIEKIQYVARKLDRPRTVCKRVECCDFKDSGKGDGEVVTIYKTHCHRECYLNNVTQDVVADPGLIQCAAFAGSSFCRSCSHSWQEHLHVIYELDEVVVKVKDQEIERQLRAKADDMTLRQTAIQRLDTYIEESKDELSEIRRATGRFWLFLKSNAITPVNNATLEYLDMLIKEEKSKVSIGRQRHMSVERNEKRLKALEAEKKDHLQLLETLDQNMREPKGPEDMMLDEKGVDEVVQRLYRLKHFGSNLRDVKYGFSGES